MPATLVALAARDHRGLRASSCGRCGRRAPAFDGFTHMLAIRPQWAARAGLTCGAGRIVTNVPCAREIEICPYKKEALQVLCVTCAQGTFATILTLHPQTGRRSSRDLVPAASSRLRPLGKLLMHGRIDDPVRRVGRARPRQLVNPTEGFELFEHRLGLAPCQAAHGSGRRAGRRGW